MMKGLEAQLSGALRPEQACLLSRTSPHRGGAAAWERGEQEQDKRKEEQKGPKHRDGVRTSQKARYLMPSHNVGTTGEGALGS